MAPVLVRAHEISGGPLASSPLPNLDRACGKSRGHSVNIEGASTQATKTRDVGVQANIPRNNQDTMTRVGADNVGSARSCEAKLACPAQGIRSTCRPGTAHERARVRTPYRTLRWRIATQTRLQSYSWYEERHRNYLHKTTPTRYSVKVFNASHALFHALRHKHITARSGRCFLGAQSAPPRGSTRNPHASSPGRALLVVIHVAHVLVSYHLKQ